VVQYDSASKRPVSARLCNRVTCCQRSSNMHQLLNSAYDLDTAESAVPHSMCMYACNLRFAAQLGCHARNPIILESARSLRAALVVARHVQPAKYASQPCVAEPKIQASDSTFKLAQCMYMTPVLFVFKRPVPSPKYIASPAIYPRPYTSDLFHETRRVDHQAPRQALSLRPP
jgi:hypothetical protein